MPERRKHTAFITGGTRGLGRALVFAFARDGYRVYTTARRAPALSELAREAEDEGLDVITLQGDIASPDDNARIAKYLSDVRHGIDVLIHNAGLLGSRVELKKYPTTLFEQVMAVNLIGPFDLTKQLLPLLREHAVIQFVTSGVSEHARSRWGAYNISKTALDRLAQIWARELGDERGLRIYLIDPGSMRTDMRAEAYPDEDPLTLDLPEDRVGVFLWLAREGDPAMSGQRFHAQEFARAH